MGILLVVFLSELSTFEHFNDFLNTFNTDIEPEESRVLGRGGGVKKSHWISVQREVGLALEQGPHRGKGLNLIT